MKLRQYMAVTGKTAVDIADTAGIRFSIVYKYLYGKKMSPESAVKVSAATNGAVSVEELLYPNGVADGAKVAANQ